MMNKIKWLLNEVKGLLKYLDDQYEMKGVLDREREKYENKHKKYKNRA